MSMSYSYQEGKDIVHFITEEDLSEYTKSEDGTKEQGVSEEVHEQYPGAVNEKGEINWDCPCLGGLGSEGPCVEEFKSAFSCWMFSSPGEDENKEKGDDCVENFFQMSMCMQQNEVFYDDLNARNKAAADEAREKYEAEERGALEAAEEEQKTQEALVSRDTNNSTDESRDANVLEAKESIFSSENIETAVLTEDVSLTSPASNLTSSPTGMTSLHSKEEQFVEFPTTVIVAAKTDDEETI